MPRRKQFLDIDVLTAAYERVNHIYDTHDAVAVLFSGGKDSLAALHVTHHVAEKRGEKTVNVIFRDEELIPDEVIKFVQSYREREWVKMYYFAVPLKSSKFILGRSFDYIQWDANRKHLRAKPDFAIVQEPGDERVFDQYTMDTYAASYFNGKVAFITGIRAAESIMRFRASVNKLNDNYINASSDVRVSLCKPLFDWQENDVFKFFYDHKIGYCSIYDGQEMAGCGLRVSTPLHAEFAKRFGMLRQYSPVFYNQIIELFPEMLIQERYYSQIDRDALYGKYAESWEGVKAWIEENLSDNQLDVALKRYDEIFSIAKKHPESYPPRNVLRYFMNGHFKRMQLPKK